MNRFCPRCNRYFNPPHELPPGPCELPSKCPGCGLPIRLDLMTGKVVKPPENQLREPHEVIKGAFFEQK
jgi:hypothetical protein